MGEAIKLCVAMEFLIMGTLKLLISVLRALKEDGKGSKFTDPRLYMSGSAYPVAIVTTRNTTVRMYVAYMNHLN